MILAQRGGLKSGLSFFTEDANFAAEHRQAFEREWEVAMMPIEGRF